MSFKENSRQITTVANGWLVERSLHQGQAMVTEDIFVFTDWAELTAHLAKVLPTTRHTADGRRIKDTD